MSQPVTKPRLIRFGLYELDLEARELRKSGVRIKLQEQPFQILRMLLERPGAVVTRDELQKALWSEDVFVDFDLSLNSAVKKLRQALSDDSENPRFIETLYRRGYRFIGPVNGAASSNGDQIDVEPVPVALAGPKLVEPSLPATKRPRHFVIYGAGALLIFLAAAVALLWHRIIPRQPPRVLGFTQITHEGSFKGGMFSDGERLYFTELDNGHFVVGQVSAEGGETSVLPTNFANVSVRGIAANRSALVVAAFEGTGKNGANWLLPLPSGAARRMPDLRVGSPGSLGALPIDSFAAAADGKQAVFSEGRDIYLANGDLSDARKVATVSNPVFFIRFSPDGRRLRFDVVDLRNGSSALWEMDTDGQHLHELLPGWSRDRRDCCGNWTPDGKYFVFQSFRDGRDSIWALAENPGWLGASKPVQLTNGPLDFSAPVPSREGKRIFVIGSQPRCELVRYDGKAGFTQYLDGRSIRDLAYSPDGKWVAYVTVPGQQLWRSRIDGSERLQLTPDTLLAGMPRWAPDGKQIVFMGTNLKTDWIAYLISSDGTGLHELMPGADAGYDPGWSPDGKSIVLTLNPGGMAPFFVGHGIAIYDLAARKTTPIPGAQNLFSPRWSPDGRYIAAITNDSTKLMLFDNATRQWQELANLTIGYPSWSHDSQYIYFDTELGEDASFYRVRISDHHLEKLFSLQGIRRYWGTFGPWTGLTADDTPLLVRDTSSQEIYAIDWDAP